MRSCTVYQVVEHYSNEWGSTSISSCDAFSDRESAIRAAEDMATEDPTSHYLVREVTFYDEEDE